MSHFLPSQWTCKQLQAWVVFAFLMHRCQGWTGSLQHAGPVSCSPLSFASPCCPKVAEEDPGVPLGAPLPAAPRRGITGEEAGPAPASGRSGGRHPCGLQVLLRLGRPWHWRRINGTPPPTAAARATAQRRSWITTTGPIILMRSCQARPKTDLFSLNWFPSWSQILFQYLDNYWMLDCRCYYHFYRFTSWLGMGLCFCLDQTIMCRSGCHLHKEGLACSVGRT